MKCIRTVQKGSSRACGVAKRVEAGFTLIELILVLGISGILLGLILVNTNNIQTSTTITATVDTIIADIKNQQTKAMVGDTEGRGIPDAYGVYFQPSQYSLFHGISYSGADAANFSIPADETIVLTSSFPNNTIVFATSSGEIIGFSQGENSLTVRNSVTGEQKVLQMNRYGTVVALD